MNEEYQERSGRGLVNLLLIIAIIGGVVFAAWRAGLFLSDKPEKSDTEVAAAADDQFLITKAEWQAMQSKLHQQQADIQQLREEVAALRQSKAKTNQSTAAKVTTSKPAATTTTSTSTTTSSNANAITMVSYTHTWLEETARISLRNNTERTITKITARISYYDMNGNMLDYRDFTKEITIEPKMSRACTIPGFGVDEHYAYYKSDSFFSQQRKYKVKFELKSYTIK